MSSLLLHPSSPVGRIDGRCHMGKGRPTEMKIIQNDRNFYDFSFGYKQIIINIIFLLL